MIKNYLAIIYRNLFKQKTSSFINIFGLAIAIACCLFILLYILDELQFDKFNKNGDRIYRLVFKNAQSDEESSLMPAALFPIVMNEIPEFEKGFRIEKWPNVSLANNQNVLPQDVYLADQDIFNVLSFSIEIGDQSKVFNNPFSVVITKSVAQEYFGKSNPIGKVLKLANEFDFEVTGILKEIPEHSSLRPSIIASINSLKTIQPNSLTDMRMSGSHFYFLLNKNATIKPIDLKLKKIFNEQFGENNEFTSEIYFAASK